MDTIDGVDSDDNPMLTRLKGRHRKRVQDSAAEDKRPLAKPKATRGRNKRTAATTSDSVEQPASRRRERLLTSELFALGARDLSDPSAANFDSAVFPAAARQQGQIMCRLLEELRKLSSCAWIVGDADARCKAIMRNAFDLQKIPATARMLKKRSIIVLYSSICGTLHPGKGSLFQDFTHVSLTASMVVERQARHFLQAREEIEESKMDQYPCLWELKNREHDAVLNGLHEMPRSPHEQRSKDLLLPPCLGTTLYGHDRLAKYHPAPWLISCSQSLRHQVFCYWTQTNRVRGFHTWLPYTHHRKWRGDVMLGLQRRVSVSIVAVS